jgi:hypothetical protein
MSILEHFQYQNDYFQSNIFVSAIGITDVDGEDRWRRSMSMPTYGFASMGYTSTKLLIF